MDIRWLQAFGGGAVTTAAVIAVNTAALALVDFNIFTLMVFFVIPVGALLCGAAAAYGFLYVCLRVHLRPGPWMLAPLVALGAVGFFGTHFGEYVTMTAAGQRVADLISFSDYLALVTGEQTLRAGRAGQVALPISGNVGLGLSALQFAGFLLGASWAYFKLAESRACLQCQKYLRALGERSRHYKDPVDGAWFYDNAMHFPVASREFDDAMRMGQTKLPEPPEGLLINSRLYDCEGCHRQLWTEEVMGWSGKDWRIMPDYSRATQVDPDVNVARYFKRRSLPFV